MDPALEQSARNGLRLAQGGLVFNAALGFAMSALLGLAGLVGFLEEGEVGPVVVLAVWCLLVVGPAVVGLVLAMRLPGPIASVLARALVVVQLLTGFCLCGIVPGVGGAAVWIGLFIHGKAVASGGAGHPQEQV
jgi:hypothetical protein